MFEVCSDNRFELIEKYKKVLIGNANLEDSPEVMAAIDIIMFRLWQLGWLDILEGNKS